MTSIRRALPAEANHLAKVFVDSRAEAMPWLVHIYGPKETACWIVELLHSMQVWVAVDETDRPVGLMVLGEDTIEHLYVDPPAQGTGVGSALVAHAKAQGNKRLSLWTFQRNIKARSFYERQGFVQVERTDGASNEEREPDLRYEWHR